MAKQKLSKGQQRRVQENHQKDLKAKTVEIDDSQLGEAQEGLVISRFGQHADIQASDGLSNAVTCAERFRPRYRG